MERIIEFFSKKLVESYKTIVIMTSRSHKRDYIELSDISLAMENTPKPSGVDMLRGASLQKSYSVQLLE